MQPLKIQLNPFCTLRVLEKHSKIVNSVTISAVVIEDAISEFDVEHEQGAANKIQDSDDEALMDEVVPDHLDWLADSGAEMKGEGEEIDGV